MRDEGCQFECIAVVVVGVAGGRHGDEGVWLHLWGRGRLEGNVLMLGRGTCIYEVC